jgi:hypothetical protein
VAHKNMDKFKIVWRQVIVFLKKYWPQVTGASVFVILLIMFMPVFRSSWLYYPESLRAKIALRKLAESTEKMYYCREGCQAKRLLYKNIIVRALASEKERILPDLEAVILDEKVLPETKKLLITLWQDSGLPPSDNLKNTSDLSIKSAWPELSDDAFINQVISNFKKAKSDSEREISLDLLTTKNHKNIISLIWDIILGTYSDFIKTKAFFLLANLDNKQQGYQVEDIAKLRSILESADFPHRLKDQAIFALGDYYGFYPAESEWLLVDVFNRPQYFDIYQRSFVIDILNNNREVKVDNLNLSQADWDKYFNN